LYQHSYFKALKRFFDQVDSDSPVLEWISKELTLKHRKPLFSIPSM
jgi:hypothetical protein